MTTLVLLSSEFPPGPGGIGTHAYQVARRLTVLGWDVRVLSARDYATDEDIARFDATCGLDVAALPSRGFPLLVAMRRRNVLRHEVAVRRPDAVLATGERSLWLAAATLRITPWIAVGHGLEFGVTSQWRRRLTRWALGRAAALVCVSAYTAGRARALRPDVRIEVIRNGADHDAFLPDPGAGRAFRAAHGLGDAPVVLTVGNLTHRKGQDLVVRALARLPARSPGPHYVLAGLPSEADAIRSLAAELGIAERVHLLGRLEAAELAAAYNACDVFVMASRHARDGDFEGLGIAVLEAALCAKPAVVTADSGLIEAVDHGRTGLVVPKEDPAALARALATLLDDADLSRSLGRSARRRALSGFTWEHAARGYDRVLRSVLRDPLPAGVAS